MRISPQACITFLKFTFSTALWILTHVMFFPLKTHYADFAIQRSVCTERTRDT